MWLLSALFLCDPSHLRGPVTGFRAGLVAKLKQEGLR